jgi:hypothetical protein
MRDTTQVVTEEEEEEDLDEERRRKGPEASQINPETQTRNSSNKRLVDLIIAKEPNRNASRR